MKLSKTDHQFQYDCIKQHSFLRVVTQSTDWFIYLLIYNFYIILM